RWSGCGGYGPDDGQVAEAMALVRALNKMTKAGMPESVRIA
ncbi:hypothetical protein WL873_25020, partial [Escherichia coli]